MIREPFDDQFVLHRQVETGWIEVICGAMFSGKTEELIRRLRRAMIARQQVEIFKPSVETRYHKHKVVSHDQTTIRSTPVEFAEDIVMFSSDCEVVGIDEAQFFDKSIVKVSNILANAGKRVIIAGLDMDYTGKPFYPMQDLMAVAEFVTKMHAVCMKCGALASYSYRTDVSREKVVLGEKDLYEARCRRCFKEGMKDRSE